MARELLYVVLPVHSRGEYDTRECLRACVDGMHATADNLRMIFVDDFCDEAGSACIKEIASRFKESYVIRTEKQRWFTRAVNLGLRLVRTPWVLVINSDCVFDKGWLDEMLAVRDEVGGSGKVGLIGSTQSGEEPRRYASIVHPDYVTGHCWLASMQAFFDCSAARGMPGWYLDETQAINIHIRSDNEICLAMQRLGYVTVKSFKSAVGHPGGRSWGHQLARIPARLDAVNDY